MLCIAGGQRCNVLGIENDRPAKAASRQTFPGPGEAHPHRWTADSLAKRMTSATPVGLVARIKVEMLQMIAAAQSWRS